MEIYGTLTRDEVGKSLFKGDLDECRIKIKELMEDPFLSFADLNICEDNGIIAERYISRGKIYEQISKS